MTLSLPVIITNMATKITPYFHIQPTILMEKAALTINEEMIEMTSNTEDGNMYTGSFCKHKTYKTVALQC